MYVLDTNVISELRKGKRAERSVRMWAQALPTASFYLSVVSVLELEIGTLLVERRVRQQGAILRAWTEGHVLLSFSVPHRYRSAYEAMRLPAKKIGVPG